MTNPDDHVAGPPDLGLGPTFQGQVFPLRDQLFARRDEAGSRICVNVSGRPRAAPIRWPFLASDED